MSKIRLETRRLVIRSLEKEDAEGVLRLLSNPIVNCFADDKITCLEEAYEHIEKSSCEFDFAVCLKETGEFTGMLFGMPEKPDTFSPCWNFIPDYFGRGYATEAAEAYFDYLFSEKGIRRIYAFTEDYNFASQGVCKKLGMREEGLFREFISFVNNPDGTPKYENTYQFAILKKEWEARYK